MPVNLEWIESPSKQDWLDLEKMFVDAPLEWFEQSADQSARAFINSMLDKDYRIAVGRFNDRLIVSSVLRPALTEDSTPIVGTKLVVQNLLVRKLTRGRGVAKQLLVRLCQWADDAKVPLCVYDEEQHYRILLEFGFLYESGAWIRQR